MNSAKTPRTPVPKAKITLIVFSLDRRLLVAKELLVPQLFLLDLLCLMDRNLELIEAQLAMLQPGVEEALGGWSWSSVSRPCWPLQVCFPLA